MCKRDDTMFLITDVYILYVYCYIYCGCTMLCFLTFKKCSLGTDIYLCETFTQPLCSFRLSALRFQRYYIYTYVCG